MVPMARGAGLVNRHYHPHEVFAHDPTRVTFERDRPAIRLDEESRPNGTFDVWKVVLATGFVDRFIRCRASGRRSVRR
jgi:2,4'-dihydroxyacetophenone dioxygenase